MSDDTSEVATENEMLTATTDSTFLYAELCKLVDENQKLERERDEARAQRDAWEKVALREANKNGSRLFKESRE